MPLRAGGGGRRAVLRWRDARRGYPEALKLLFVPAGALRRAFQNKAIRVNFAYGHSLYMAAGAEELFP